jgi:hypothetical protein
MKQILSLIGLVIGGVIVNSCIVLPAIFSNPEFPFSVNLCVAICELIVSGYVFALGCERIYEYCIALHNFAEYKDIKITQDLLLAITNQQSDKLIEVKDE